MPVSTGGSLALDLGDSVTMKFVLIPAGTFQMGSPANEKYRDRDETQHTVKLTKAFYMGVTEVTQAQWKAMMGTTPWAGRHTQDGADNAASNISWNDATAFCKKMSARTGKAIRLPTEDTFGRCGSILVRTPRPYSLIDSILWSTIYPPTDQSRSVQLMETLWARQPLSSFSQVPAQYRISPRKNLPNIRGSCCHRILLL